MWFGDLVTMRWFNDVWMKEVFANFMAAKIVNPSFPEVNHELRFLLAHYPAAYEVDRTPGANPIRQPLANLNEAGSLYGAIIYQKAPIVMRHLESLMGEEVFRDGLREYLKKYSFGNATWSDLIAILDARTPADLAAWSQRLGRGAGPADDRRPSSRSKGGKIARLAFRQIRSRASASRVWPQELRDRAGLRRSIAADHGRHSTRPSVEVPEAVGLPAPLYVLPNGGGWAYGGFALDARSLAYLSTSAAASCPIPLTRGAAWVTLWDALLDQRISRRAVRRPRATALPRETDEQLTSRILGYCAGAWWRFLAPARAPGARARTRERCCRRDWPRRRRRVRKRRGSARSATSR